MAEVVDLQNQNRLIEVPDEQVQEKFLRGEIGFSRDQRVPVFHQGQHGTMSAEEAARLMRSGDARFATTEERQHQALQREHGGVAGVAATAAEGAANAATLGGYGAAARHFAPGYADEMVARQQANPGANTVGEVAGTVLPALIPGVGEAAVARTAAGRAAVGAAELATAPMRAVGAIGRAVEGGVSRAIGEQAAASIAGRVAQRVAPMAAAGVVEGGVIGGAQALGEAALGDHELTAEQLLSHVGLGALAGGVGGTAIPAAGMLVSGSTRRLATGLAQLYERTTGSPMARALAERYLQAAAPGGRRELLETFLGSAGSREARRIATEGEAGLQVAGRQLGRNLDQIASVDSRLATAAQDQAARVVARSVERGDSPQIAEEIGQALRSYQRSSEQFRGSYIGEGATHAPEKVHSLLGSVTNARADSRLASIGEHVQAQRQLLDTLGKYNVITPELRAVGKQLDSIQAGLKSTTETIQSRVVTGNQWRELQRLEGDKGDFGDLASKAAGAVGFAVGGPKLALAANVATQAVRSPTKAIRVLAALERAQDVVNKKLNSGVREWAEGALKAGARGVARGARRTSVSVADFEPKVAQYSEDPHSRAERITRALDSWHNDAPQVSAQFALKAGQAMAAVQERMPRPQMQAGSLLPNMQRTQVPNSVKLSWLRFARAAENPLTIIDDLKDRKLTPESVEAVKTLYPQLFERVVTQVQEHLMTATKLPPYDDRIQLGILLGVPTDPSLQPQRIQSMQMTYEQITQSVQQGPSPRPTSSVMRSTQQVATKAERITQ